MKQGIAGCCLVVALFLISCGGDSVSKKTAESKSDVMPHAQKDTFQLLNQCWDITDAMPPTSRDIDFRDNHGVALNSGIVFMSDSVVLENPKGEWSYGKFSLTGNEINATYENGRKAKYHIEKLDSATLILKRKDNKGTSVLTYKGTGTYWPDAAKNPFSKQNYKWAQQPKKAETDDEIKKRVKACIQFYAYYLQGFVNGGAKSIGYEALPNCFNFYVGGIFVQSEKKLDNKWIQTFYSLDQALKGRQILEDAVSKKYNWDSTQTNWLKQTVPVLQQMADQL